MQAKWNLMMLAALGCSTLAGATDLTIHLNGTQPLSRKTVQYQCDAKGAAMGLPATRISGRIHQRGRKQPGGCSGP